MIAVYYRQEVLHMAKIIGEKNNGKAVGIIIGIVIGLSLIIIRMVGVSYIAIKRDREKEKATVQVQVQEE